MIGVIPAAGRGKRLGDLSKEIPKPLVRLNGKPLIDYAIEDLIKVGCRKIVIIIGYLGDKIRDHVISIYPSLCVEYIEQKEQLGLGHAVLLSKPAIDSTFVVVLPDSVNTVLFDYVIKKHQEENAFVTMLVKPQPKKEFSGKHTAIQVDDEKISKIVEKSETPLTHRSKGLYICSPKFYDYLAAIPISARGEYEITDAIQAAIDDDQLVIGIDLKGEQIHITKKEDLKK